MNKERAKTTTKTIVERITRSVYGRSVATLTTKELGLTGRGVGRYRSPILQIAIIRVRKRFVCATVSTSVG